MNCHPYDSWQLPSTSECYNQAQSAKLSSAMENGRKLKSRTAKTSRRTQMEQQPDPESLIETMKMADEMNLINLVDEVDDLVLLEVDDDRKPGGHLEEEDKMENKLLPRQAIIFDYTLQPVGCWKTKGCSCRP
uniref:Uncharacterized protein n=1 Tax=Ditylenchus dipsaci TaxID=166011 RepID=A0A915EM37_9BILA